MNAQQKDFEVRLLAMLRLKAGSKEILHNRESSQLEFKESFNLGSKAKYARTMASFSNNRGGFIVYGVKPTPHKLKGVNASNFDSCDPSKITEFLNSHFSPELEWEMGSVEAFGFRLGFTFSHEATEKPVIAISNCSGEIAEGEIYYRYKAQSTKIRYPELRQIIEERVGRERKAWMDHIQAISRSGPLNVGILDTVQGHIYTGGPPFLIDDSLLRQIRFVKQGRFTQTQGNPTLRLIGDVQAVTGIKKEVPIGVGIHVEDLFTAFLAQRHLDESQAKAYLRETSYQASPFLPLHYYVRLSTLSKEEAIKIIHDSTSSFKSTKERLVLRLKGKDKVKPIGPVDTLALADNVLESSTLTEALKAAKSKKDCRTLLIKAIRLMPKDMVTLTDKLPLASLFEAITHLENELIKAQSKEMLHLLLKVFTDRYQVMTPMEKTLFRRAVTKCDDALFEND